MENSPLNNMIPLHSYKDKIIIEFNDICEFVYDVTHCSGYKSKENKYFKNGINKGISEILRYFGFKFKPTRISERAFVSDKYNELKEELSKNDKLYENLYKNRLKNYPLYFEHIVPIKSLIDRCKNCTSLEEVEKVLEELEFIIILKAEDEMLSEKGYYKKGRETLEKAIIAYQKCNIQLKKLI